MRFAIIHALDGLHGLGLLFFLFGLRRLHSLHRIHRLHRCGGVGAGSCGSGFSFWGSRANLGLKLVAARDMAGTTYADEDLGIFYGLTFERKVC